MINESTRRIRVSFSCEDQYGNVTTLDKDVDEDYLEMNELEIMLDLYRDFLFAVGYTFVADGHLEFVDEKDC